jgi:predicted nucleotidyltransferase
MFGLLDRDISEMTKAFASRASIEKVILYGSRAKGNYKNGSDVDLTILGENLSEDIISDLNAFLNEETNMPYYFDLVNYNTLTNKALINHIDRVGKVIYSREK